MTNTREPTTNLFADWLDSFVDGTSTPDTESDAELTSLCSSARQLHALDEHLGRYGESISLHAPTWEDLMITRTHALQRANEMLAFPMPAPVESRRLRRISVPMRLLDRTASVFLIVALLLVTAFGVGRYSGDIPFLRTLEPTDEVSFLGGPAGQDGNDNLLAPGMGAAKDGETSSWPYPTASECTVTPLTRDEVVQHLKEANVATLPEFSAYAQPIVPSPEESQAIMASYRQYQACGLNGRALAYQMALETPWNTANQSALFMINGRPVSDEMIEEWADIVIADEATPSPENPDAGLYPATFPTGTPESEAATPMTIPIPAGATAVPNVGGKAFPTIFPDDIVLVAPDRAQASATWVDEKTGEVRLLGPKYLNFVRVDGQWLIDSSRDGSLG